MILALAACNRSPHANAKAQIVPPGAGRTIEFPGVPTRVLLDGPATQGDVAVVEFIVPPRSFGALPHTHSREDEYFYVLNGEVRFLDDDRTVVAPAGTFAAMPRGHLHAFWNASAAPARVLMAVTPGEFVRFFDAVATNLSASKAHDLATVRATIGRLAQTYGIVDHADRVPEEAKPFLPH
jgi:mannose-6-phosphate isomerase-like protein (cupin superfamily)